MNQQELVSFALFVTMCLVCGFAGTALRRWLLHRCFPAFRLEPWLFEPIRQSDLTAEQRHFFETHTPVFLARGFSPLGDFVLRRDRQASVARYFLGPDRLTVGELTCYLNSQTIGCMSVLLDGFYLESGNVELDQPPPAEHGLMFFTSKTDDAAEVIDRHAAGVARIAAQRGSPPAELQKEDVKALSNYGRELSLRSLHKQGVLEELPAFLRKKQQAATTCR